MICHKCDPFVIDKVVEFLKDDKVVILPTDTVYGFSAAVGPAEKKIKQIKGRADTKPFIQLVSCSDDVKLISDDKIPDEILKYWPGPLTVIVRKKESQETVAVRCPGDQWLRNIIKRVGKPVYSTSLNRSGFPVLENEKDIINEFEKEVSIVVLDGDKCGAVPSTIVKIIDGKIEVLREGSIKI